MQYAVQGIKNLIASSLLNEWDMAKHCIITWLFTHVRPFAKWKIIRVGQLKGWKTCLRSLCHGQIRTSNPTIAWPESYHYSTSYLTTAFEWDFVKTTTTQRRLIFGTFYSVGNFFTADLQFHWPSSDRSFSTHKSIAETVNVWHFPGKATSCRNFLDF